MAGGWGVHATRASAATYLPLRKPHGGPADEQRGCPADQLEGDLPPTGWDEFDERVLRGVAAARMERTSSSRSLNQHSAEQMAAPATSLVCYVCLWH